MLAFSLFFLDCKPKSTPLMANNAWSQSTLGKDGNGLLTDQAKGGYYEAKITWWLFRNQITPMIDASFGLLAGVDGASYTDFMYINPKNSNVTEYKSVIAGIAGIQAAVSLRLSEKWILQPSFVTYYDFGKQFLAEAVSEYTSNYAGVMTNIAISMICRTGDGNAFVYQNFQQTNSKIIPARISLP